METLSITQITPPELQEMIREGIREAFKEAQPKQEHDPDERLTRRQVCNLYKISFPTLHAQMHAGLPYEKVGRKTVFRRQAVDKFFQSKRGMI